MSTLRTPVGPQSSRVYRRRRLVVGLVLLAVILVVVLLIVRPGSTTPVPVATRTSTGSPTPAPTSTDPADAVACDPGSVEVEAVTDAGDYAAGVNPVLSFTLKSRMSVPCTMDAGSDLQEFVVTSGDERIWSSKDCQTDPVAATILLLPGVPKSGSSVTWDRTRSATDTCDSEREQVIAEGASYHLDVSVGEFASAESRQFLLD